MRVLVQRSLVSSVEVDGTCIGKISSGMVVLVGFTHKDTIKEIEELVSKLLHLRIFDDEAGVMNRSILDTKGQILCISQFTLYGSTKKGNRPSYVAAMPGEQAKELYELFCEQLSASVTVKRGIFGANMKVQITNDGPVTILLESRKENVKE